MFMKEIRMNMRMYQDIFVPISHFGHTDSSALKGYILQLPTPKQRRRQKQQQNNSYINKISESITKVSPISYINKL